MLKLMRLALTVVLVCIALHGCSGAEDRRARALERGQQFLAAHNYSKARVEFNNALQIQPNDADARYFAGLTAEKLNDLRASAQGYQSALNVDPTHALASAALGRLYVFSGLPQQGLEIVQKSLEAHPDHPELVIVRAAAELALGDERAAFDDATAVIEKQPSHEYAVALLAGIHRKRGEGERAIVLVERALVDTPDSIDLRTVLAQLYLDAHDLARTEKELQKIIELQPDAPQYRQQLVAFYTSQGRQQDAERVLRDLIQLQPDSVENKFALIGYLANQKNLDTAESELAQMLAGRPNDHRLRLAAGEFYESRSLPADAERLYTEVITAGMTEPAGLLARDRLAALRIRTNRVSEAKPLIDEVLAKNPRDNDALVLRASLALAGGHAVDAITDLRAVLRDQPESVPVLRTLAQAHAQNNEPDLAVDNYRHALQLDPANDQLRLEYAGYLNRRGENAEAKPLLEALLAKDPGNVAALEAQFRVLGALRDTKGAAASAAKIVETQPSNALGYYLEGLVQESENDLPKAVASYERSLEKEPQGVESLGALMRVMLRLNQRDAVRARLEKVVAEYPDHTVALNMLAEMMLADRNYDRAVTLTDGAIAANPRWWLPYRTKALAQLAGGSKEAAKKTYDEGLAASGDTPALGMDLAALYERDSEPDRAIEIYEKLHGTNPSFEPIANNLAMLLVTYRSDADSYDRADQLVRGFRNATNPAYLNTYGWVRYRQRQFDEAVSYLRRASTAAPDNPLMHYHLGMALIANGAPDQARAELEKALAAKEAFPGKDAAQRALDSLPRAPG